MQFRSYVPHRISWWTAIWLSRKLSLVQFCMQFFLSRYQAERQSRLWLELNSLQWARSSAENCHPCVTMCHNKIIMKQYRTCPKGFRNAISDSVFYAYRQRTVSFTTGAAFHLSFTGFLRAGTVLCWCRALELIHAVLSSNVRLCEKLDYLF